MTDQNGLGLAWVPGACTLPTVEQPQQVAELEALFTAAGCDAERVAQRHLRVTSSGGSDLADSVCDLAGRETACCSFFSFSVSASKPDMTQLDVEVRAGRVDVLEALQARAAAVRGAA